MNLVDSCGWLEYFGNGPNADFFADPIKGTDPLIVPTICIYEVYRRFIDQRGLDLALRIVARIRQCQVIDLDTKIAMQAVEMSLEHKLPLADSIILATAREYHATLWTQDADFENIPGVRFKPK